MHINIFILTQYTPVRSTDLESFDAHVITSLGVSDSESVLIMYHEKLSFQVKLFLIHARKKGVSRTVQSSLAINFDLKTSESKTAV